MSERYVAYTGSYTHETTMGIHIFDVDVEKGRIKERKEIIQESPSYIVLSHSEKFLYSICANGVAAYRVLEDGDLELINTHSIRGIRGCYLTLNRQDTFLIVSGYYDGKITVLHLNSDGSIGDIADEVFHKGIGSVAERNYRPHISCAEFTPDEELLCVCDLGIDQIKVYEFNHKTGKLDLFEIIRTQLDSAPRQITFSPDGRFAYVVCELKNYINVYSYNKDSDGGRFEFIQNIFTVRKNHKSNSAASHFIFTSDGEHCLCSNAGDNTLTIYDVDKENGTLSMLSSLPISGEYPKFITLFPDDKHVMCMNNEGSTITIFTIHFDKGLIVMNGPEIKIAKPDNLILKKLAE
jgi:6-phosphogluconolactonase